MKRRLLPEAMLKRWPPMILWIVGIAYTTFDDPGLATTTGLLALLAIGFTLLLYLLWGPRTRPRRNAFWFLVHILILGAVIALAGAKPILAAVVTVPVGLLWLHDSPASPSAMLSWGVAMVLWPPDFWSGAEADVAWNVMFAVILMIAAAQFERNRLASRHFTQAGVVFSVLRLVGVLALSMFFVAGREGLRAVNVFTYLGIDASGVAGKITMLSIVAVSLAAAVALFRVRPEKPPQTIVPATRPSDPVDPRAGPIDFDEPSKRPGSDQSSPRKGMDVDGTRPPSRTTPPPPRGPARQPAKAEARTPAKPAPRKPAAKPSRSRRDQGPAQPGELDFD